jgi:hypothetical protein
VGKGRLLGTSMNYLFSSQKSIIYDPVASLILNSIICFKNFRNLNVKFRNVQYFLEIICNIKKKPPIGNIVQRKRNTNG